MPFDCPQGDANRNTKTPPNANTDKMSIYASSLLAKRGKLFKLFERFNRLLRRLDFRGYCIIFQLLKMTLADNVNNLTGHHDDLFRRSTLQLLLGLFVGHYGRFDFVFAHIQGKFYRKAHFSVK